MAWRKRLASWGQSGLPTGNAFRDVEPEAVMPVLWRGGSALPGPLVAVFPLLSQAEEAAEGLSLWAEAAGLSLPPPLLVPETVSGQKFMPEQEAARARVLFAAAQGHHPLFVASVTGLLSPTPTPRAMSKSLFTLGTNAKIAPEELLRRLLALDYDDEYEVSIPGEFARRGGIVDIFSPAHDLPVRIEFFGDAIESLRLFSPESQRSVREVTEYTIIPRSAMDETLAADTDFLDCFPGRAVSLALVFPESCREHLARFEGEEMPKKWDRLVRNADPRRVLRLLDPVESAECSVGELAGCHAVAGLLGKTLPDELGSGYGEWLRQLTVGQIRQWLDTGYETALLGRSEAACAHLAAWIREAELPAKHIAVAVAETPHGIVLPAARLAILTEREIFAATPHHLRLPVRPPPRPAASTGLPDTGEHAFPDLDEGDYAVHLLHGIGIYRGLHEIAGEDGTVQEMLKLEFADDIALYVPIWQADVISRYVGAGRILPKLSKVGGRTWARTRTAAARALRELAMELLRFQAVRAQHRGTPFPPDDLEQQRFEAAFSFLETPDQRRATDEVKTDMILPRPMDRLLCGDVGYGKTEVAMRAAFKAVAAGKQVAVLVPTTILAQQHYYSFSERFAEYPVLVDMLSRFRTPAEQQLILHAVREKRLDIVIGTHRLLQGDVRFADLGLVIVDEEQRFGVIHKERLKRLRAEVDVLTLTATPIPRTLYMAMTGLRDLSTIMTAPGARLPVETIVCQQDDRIIRTAIEREIGRGGQVFYLHNRVKTIAERARALGVLVPDARIGIGHGQMPENELEDVMAAFLDGKLDVLVCTTIIESGLDIPNANTIFIERADRFGLADLYQLRGRVGRWTRQAHAYLLLPQHGIIVGTARQRLAAIRRYTELGAGFKLALRDLEIRGAGNLLGAEQSGHINAIGFELYCQILRVTVAELQGNPNPLPPEVDLDLDFIEFAHAAGPGKIAAAIPPEYLPAERVRLDAYRRLSRLGDEDAIAEFARGLVDRCGPLPPPAKHLLDVARLRLVAGRHGWRTLRVKDRLVVLTATDRSFYRPGDRLPRLTAQTPEKQLKELLGIIRNAKSPA
ncbi:MAG: transcription-repair coupling factor [Rhodospirillales bacterium]|jgi:transcription-repair coupling factor (superfamily II helicase)|nr:transcription-repair coupling factor [Rhodospirillales bacterium]